MASLPETLHGTYKQYKADTDRIVAWLAETAQGCGYRLPRSQLPVKAQLPQISAPKLKGRARKLARDAAHEKAKSEAKIGTATFVVRLGDFLPMAKAIAGFRRPPVEVPWSFVKVAKRVLVARRRCTSWFQQQPQDGMTDLKNQSHLHFINILERVVEVLTPRFANAPTAQKQSKAPARHTDTGVPRDLNKDALNRFEALSVEETVTDDEVTMPLPSESSPTLQKASKIVFESEKVSDDEELLFACFCLLEDLNKIRSYLSDVWKKFLCQETSLVTASLVTDAALDMTRRMEQDFWRQFPTRPWYSETFAMFFYNTACKARGQPGLVTENGRIQTDGLFNPSMSDVVDWTFLHAWDIMEQNRSRYGFVYFPRSEEQLGALIALEPSLMVARADLGPVSMSMEAYMVHFTSVVALSSRLTHLFSEEGEQLIKDNLVRGLASCLLKAQEVPVWLAFAAQVYFDLQDLLQDAGMKRAAAQALTEYQTVQDGLSSYSNFLALRKEAYARGGGTTERLKKFERIMKMTVEASLALKKESIQEILARDPTLCGLAICNLHLLSQVVGQLEADLWGSIVIAAHVYNAAQQEAILSIDWPDLELVIDIHSVQHLFIGGRPASRDKYYSRLSMAMGLSILAEKRPSRCGQRDLSTGRTPFCKLLNGLSRCSYDAKDDRAEDLELIVAMVTKDATARKKIKLLDGGTLNRAELRRECAGLPTATSLQLLQQLEKHITTEMAELHFDYLDLTIRCCLLAEKVKKTCYEIFPPEDGVDPDVSAMTPQCALLLLQEPVALCTCPNKTCSHNDSQMVPLRIFAKVYAEYIAENGSTEIEALQRSMPSYRRRSSDQGGRPQQSGLRKSSCSESQPFRPDNAGTSITDEEKEAMRHLVRKKVERVDESANAEND